MCFALVEHSPETLGPKQMAAREKAREDPQKMQQAGGSPHGAGLVGEHARHGFGGEGPGSAVVDLGQPRGWRFEAAGVSELRADEERAERVVHTLRALLVELLVAAGSETDQAWLSRTNG